MGERRVDAGGARLNHGAIQMTPKRDQMLSENSAVAVGIEHIVTGVQQCANAVQIEEKLELADRVVPCSGVVAADERGERGERLYLDIVFPPARPEDQPIAVAQPDRIVPQLVP